MRGNLFILSSCRSHTIQSKTKDWFCSLCTNSHENRMTFAEKKTRRELSLKVDFLCFDFGFFVVVALFMCDFKLIGKEMVNRFLDFWGAISTVALRWLLLVQINSKHISFGNSIHQSSLALVIGSGLCVEIIAISIEHDQKLFGQHHTICSVRNTPKDNINSQFEMAFPILIPFRFLFSLGHSFCVAFYSNQVPIRF